MLSDELREKKKRSLETGHVVLEASKLEVIELDRGVARVRMPIDVNANHIGTFYAGSLFILAEVTGAALFSGSFDSKHFYPIVKDMRIRFRRPARTDVRAEASLTEGEIVALSERAKAEGKVDYPWRCELIDTAGEVVAIAEGVFQIRWRGV